MRDLIISWELPCRKCPAGLRKPFSRSRLRRASDPTSGCRNCWTVCVNRNSGNPLPGGEAIQCFLRIPSCGRSASRHAYRFLSKNLVEREAPVTRLGQTPVLALTKLSPASKLRQISGSNRASHPRSHKNLRVPVDIDEGLVYDIRSLWFVFKGQCDATTLELCTFGRRIK